MVTLHSPDMKPTFQRVRGMILRKGILLKPEEEETTLYPNGTIVMELKLASETVLQVSWSHVLQRVTFAIRESGRRSSARQGNFGHVSQVGNEAAYWNRIESWMNRNIEWSRYRGDAGEIISGRRQGEVIAGISEFLCNIGQWGNACMFLRQRGIPARTIADTFNAASAAAGNTDRLEPGDCE